MRNIKTFFSFKNDELPSVYLSLFYAFWMVVIHAFMDHELLYVFAVATAYMLPFYIFFFITKDVVRGIGLALIIPIYYCFYATFFTLHCEVMDMLPFYVMIGTALLILLKLGFKFYKYYSDNE